MKTDIIIYGRGQERLSGYQTFTAPEYWSDAMLSAMMGFSQMHEDGDLSSKYPERFVSADPWGRTYIFIAMPEPFCCALLRVTRVEGDTPGEWLREVRNKEIWSLEGFCAPFEKKDEFFAMVPSMILWFENDKRSLYGRFRLKEIEGTVDIPDEFLVNPYHNASVGGQYEQIMGDSYNAWVELTQAIRFSNGVFHFLFGPFADVFAPPMKQDYNITGVYCTDTAIRQHEDPFDKIRTIRFRKMEGIQKRHMLELHIEGEDTGNPRREWVIVSKRADGTEADPPLHSPWFSVRENGIDIHTLIAQYETIKLFVVKMQWTVEDNGLVFIEEA
ncbi:MAG: hypothetical protein II695_04630 [Oscillospiraceae bacterium]|nr:hypothetical protein [Oscillospiraceae bacterium]